MDNLQAALLLNTFKQVKKIIKIRRNNNNYYLKNLTKKLILNYEEKDQFNTYHTFVVHSKNRSNLQKYLKSKGIETKIHYPYLVNNMIEFKRYNFNKDIL